MRPMPRDDALLLDMLLYCDEASRLAAAITFSEFEASRLHQLAIFKAVETVGEAASKVSDERRDAMSGIPWPEVIGMRNRLVHGYGAIQLEVVWRTVQEDIPALARQLRPIVPREGA